MQTLPDWDDLVREVSPALYRYFCARLAPGQADDCVQETWTRLVLKIEGGLYDPTRGNFRMYAYGIARLVRLEAQKARVELLVVEDESNHQTPEATLALEQERRRLRQAMNTLSDTQQEILLLHLDQEMTLTAIGELLSLPVGTVKSHIHRAKEALKNSLSSANAKEGT